MVPERSWKVPERSWKTERSLKDPERSFKVPKTKLLWPGVMFLRNSKTQNQYIGVLWLWNRDQVIGPHGSQAMVIQRSQDWCFWKWDFFSLSFKRRVPGKNYQAQKHLRIASFFCLYGQNLKNPPKLLLFLYMGMFLQCSVCQSFKVYKMHIWLSSSSGIFLIPPIIEHYHFL